MESRLRALAFCLTEAVQLVFLFSFFLSSYRTADAGTALLQDYAPSDCFCHFFLLCCCCHQISVVCRDNRGRRNKIRSAFVTVHATIGDVNDLLARISLSLFSFSFC